MTANTLSNSDRAKVASAVTGWKALVREERVWVYPPGVGYAQMFIPSFTRNEAQRSYALRLLEWLFDKTKPRDGISIHSCEWADELYGAMNNKDTAALEKLVFQMITKGKEDE